MDVAVAKEAALAASAAASAAEKEVAVAAVTAKEAAAASAAAVTAKEAALAASAAASAAAKEAEVVAVTASEAAATAKEAAVAASAAASNAKEAAAVAATTGEVAAAAAATAMAAMQASKKLKFHLICDQDSPGSGSCDDVDAGSVDLSNDVDGGSVDLSDDVDGRSVDPIDDVDVGIVDLIDNVDGGSVDLSDDVDEGSVDLISYFDLGSADHISRLPDAVLGSILSLLPIKEGARTQIISRRWRPLWRSAPLNLVVDYKNINLVPKILSEHRGPARRFSIEDCYVEGRLRSYTRSIYVEDCYDKIEGWLSSAALDNLEELELTPEFSYGYLGELYLLQSSTYRFSSTLRVAKFHCCHFPNLIVQLSLKFSCLKQLTLRKVTISEDPLHSLLSGCTAFESLELKENMGTGRLCIISQTLKSLGFCADSRDGGLFLQELVIKDAPCLERLLPLNPKGGTASIRIISAPKLEMLGMLSEDTYEFHLGSSVFQKMIAVNLTTKMHTMRVLVLSPSSPKLDAVVNLLKCFPCLERLYVIVSIKHSCLL
ncbi:putative F-box/FBD/LRR-repeat protein At5g44950 [Triticum dicoccoides]|uniref:putative F-box/FBD/LRR-repeat protein At5g44950 n=1 Tax=Triticum dicoccoides TaxID=85692 RepID=UPI00188F8A46|nr:putative F-box/FBD/LRR-repeat protein At5g44950 [Triticum dicoccoides]